MPASAYALAISSSSEIDGAANELARIRDDYQVTGVAAAGARERIIKSWERCRAMRVDPRAKEPLIRRDPEELRCTNELLLRASDPILTLLADALADTGYLVVLADASGHVLHVAGELRARLSSADAGIVPGADFSEASAGTNAVGTAIADRRALQLLAGEHFCDVAQDLTCTAAPIYLPEGREIAGVLALSGNYRLVRSQLIDVAMQGALDVEDQLGASLRSAPE
ncbi:MAG TPA: hypothetical protein VE591_14100 [Candidatus Acidoferrum sp.]|nr:hypothetical protein [Candidatus Acidoferrum sp.]